MPAPARNTRQKAALRTAFLDTGRPLSPDEALRIAQHHVPGMSIATVYRNIGSLVDDGWLTPVELPGAPARYEVAGKDHHHHFQCNSCAKVYELQGCVIPAQSSLPRGFKATGHDFFLYGTCAECR